MANKSKKNQNAYLSTLRDESFGSNSTYVPRTIKEKNKKNTSNIDEEEEDSLDDIQPSPGRSTPILHVIGDFLKKDGLAMALILFMLGLIYTQSRDINEVSFNVKEIKSGVEQLSKNISSHVPDGSQMNQDFKNKLILDLELIKSSLNRIEARTR